VSPASERSRYVCPRCGEHRLAIIEFPRQHSVGFVPANEIIGMGEPTVLTPPAIGCLACGAEWPTLERFRDESGEVDEADQADEANQTDEAETADAGPMA